MVKKIWLRRHPINGGKIYTGARNYETDRKHGDHLGMVESSADMATELLLENLKEYSFKSHYKSKVRLTLVISRNQSSTTKEIIRCCQVQHKTILDSIKTEY